MNIGVAYADHKKHVWLKFEVSDGSTVCEVIKHSGPLKQFSEIDLDNQRVGIFDRLTRVDAVVKKDSRVEIYHPIIANPETVECKER